MSTQPLRSNLAALFFVTLHQQIGGVAFRQALGRNVPAPLLSAPDLVLSVTSPFINPLDGNFCGYFLVHYAILPVDLEFSSRFANIDLMHLI